jgi:hypothetical protein
LPSAVVFPFSACAWQVKYGGIGNLWRDAMQRHGQVRYHLQVGGGDQLYADRLFHLPSLQPWLKIDNHEVRLLVASCWLLYVCPGASFTVACY